MGNPAPSHAKERLALFTRLLRVLYRQHSLSHVSASVPNWLLFFTQPWVLITMVTCNNIFLLINHMKKERDAYIIRSQAPARRQLPIILPLNQANMFLHTSEASISADLGPGGLQSLPVPSPLSPNDRAEDIQVMHRTPEFSSLNIDEEKATKEGGKLCHEHKRLLSRWGVARSLI